MNTDDPRFTAAYNGLVNAFFNFINVVNPAPSRDEQIMLICNSLKSLVSTLENGPSRDTISCPEPAPEKPGQAPAIPRPAPTAPNPAPTEPQRDEAPAPKPVAVSGYTEKRYGMEPTLTGEEVYKFIKKSLKKENTFDQNLNPDAPDKKEYPFIVEYNDEVGDGEFYLNDTAILDGVFDGAISADVVQLAGNPTISNWKITSNGKLVKSTGGYEVVSPLQITQN